MTSSTNRGPMSLQPAAGDYFFLCRTGGVDGRLVIGAFGDFRITGGEGAYESASGSGKVVNAYPGTYVGEIYR